MLNDGCTIIPKQFRKGTGGESKQQQKCNIGTVILNCLGGSGFEPGFNRSPFELFYSYYYMYLEYIQKIGLVCS